MRLTAWPKRCPTPISAGIRLARSWARLAPATKRSLAIWRITCARPRPRRGSRTIPSRAPPSWPQRVAPLARREREVAEALSAIDPEPRAVPQRDRAARRAVEFADALETLRQQAPTVAPLETKPDEPRPLAAWRVLGAFPIDSPPPFPIDKTIDLVRSTPTAKVSRPPGSHRRPSTARAPSTSASSYGRDDKLAAFGYSEIPSPAARSARMLIGSDDTLTVWLNGKTVYDFRE